MKKWFAFLLLALAAALSAAHAQEWPARPVRIVVAFPPGGLTDVLARMFAARLSEEFGQPFIVDNRPGAGGTIGTEHVVNSKPDGYTTILLPSSFAATPGMYKLAYDPIKGIAPIAIIATMPFVLLVHPSVKANNPKELIELARANPGTLNFGSAGVGTDLHLALELFRQMTNTDMVHVAYKGIAPALSDLLGGTIQLMYSTALSASPHLKSGKLRAIAVSTEQRSPAMPDLPSISETVPGYTPKFWFGMGATGGTPNEIVTLLNQAVARSLTKPDVQERLRAGGVEPAHSTSEEFSRVIAHDIAMWSNVIKTGNIKAN
jgi:tripartite-type tricarboxylate transporter receptor subunit TctC